MLFTFTVFFQKHCSNIGVMPWDKSFVFFCRSSLQLLVMCNIKVKAGL